MKRLAPVLVLALGVPALAVAAPAAREVAPAAAGSALSVSRRLVADLASALAAGDLAMTGNVWLSIPPDGLSFELTGLCVENYRSSAAYDVNVEVWASKTVPSTFSVPPHYVGGTFSIGTLNGYSQRCQNSGTLPATPPPPDVYWISLALYEGTGSSRTLHQVFTFSEQVDAGGPVKSETATLYFEKPVSHFLTNGGNTASTQVGRIRNTSSSATRRLALELWATTTPPRFGQTITGRTLAAREYSPLNAYSSYTNVDTGSLAVTQPPAGTYWITTALVQLGTDGVTWYYYCLYTFPAQYTFTGASPAPVADFTFSPSSPQAGQTVTFTDTSTGSPTSWAWSFGDGQSSTLRSPTHAFSVSGVYNVTLTASNASGSSSKTRTVVATAVAAPSITYFGANPPAVSPGQQAILSWTSTGGTAATIDQGVGSVPTNGNVTVTPVVGVPYTLTVTGPGGSATAKVTVSAVPSTWAGTWLLPSSARAPGANAFWTTDLTVTNAAAQSAAVNLKFLGHDGAGASGPERSYTVPARATLTLPDVLSAAFGRETDWGPILVRSNVTAIVAQGQTWTASPSGGSYGQSVPALGASETVGAASRVLPGVRQDSRFRTNVVLANLKETEAAVTLQVLLADGTTATTWTTTVGPLGFRQVNLASDLGVANLVGGSVLVSSTTPGAQVAAYASVIDASTADPRTILAR